MKERQQTGREVKAKVNCTTNVNRSVSSAMLLGEGMTFYWHILLLRGERAAPSELLHSHHTDSWDFPGEKSSNWVCRCMCVCVCVDIRIIYYD